jgi:ribonucleoside-triphosphate reductase (formate)
MKKPKCPKCGSKKVYGISRIVGYFAKIEEWNKSKIAELRDRRKGNYDV